MSPVGRATFLSDMLKAKYDQTSQRSRRLQRRAKPADRPGCSGDVGKEGRTNLRKQLREGAQARAERDLHVTEAWFALGDDV